MEPLTKLRRNEADISDLTPGGLQTRENDVKTATTQCAEMRSSITGL